jgi:hypothetical protein
MLQLVVPKVAESSKEAMQQWEVLRLLGLVVPKLPKS